MDASLVKVLRSHLRLYLFQPRHSLSLLEREIVHHLETADEKEVRAKVREELVEGLEGGHGRVVHVTVNDEAIGPGRHVLAPLLLSLVLLRRNCNRCESISKL